MLRKSMVTLLMSLILKEEKELTLAYIKKIENVIKYPYWKVNLEFKYAFRISFIATNNQFAFIIFLIWINLVEIMWVLDSLCLKN